MKPEFNTWQPLLFDAVSETLEGMAFVELEPPAQQSPSLDSLHCTIAIRTPFSGALVLSLSKRLACNLASAAIGEDVAESDDELIRDAAGEFLNTIAGRFLSKVCEEHTDFTVGLPCFARPLEMHDCLRVQFGVAGLPVQVELMERN